MWAVLSVCVLVWGAGCAQQFLLPGDVRPRSYELRLLYDLDPATNFPYYGAVDILITATKSVSKLILHAQGFSIPERGVMLSGSRRAPQVTRFQVNSTTNFLTVTLSGALRKHANYTLTVPFYGNLKPALNGVYISKYEDKATGQKEYLVTTQFEAIYARKGFPCFDEPIYKATFRIHIGHHSDYTAISNMPVDDSTKDNLLEEHWPWSEVKTKFKKDKSKFVWDSFENSVPMSTYLVAFVISKFSYVESPAGLSDTVFRVWASKDAIKQTHYASTVGPKILSFFEKFFNVSYPLPKQDMIAIPDFETGAMENWGLIIYREVTMLYDEKGSPSSIKEAILLTIAHELAHQWFGNLVTMKWWNDLWLNEGFATFMATIGMTAIEPDWNAENMFTATGRINFLLTDSLETSRPVSPIITDPRFLRENFDTITYQKGSAIVRMMTMCVGEDVFRHAIHNYLVKYSYSNAEQDDLWRELTAASQQYGGLTRNVSVKQIMDTWTTQTGYPLLTVTRDYSDATVAVEQKRYLQSGAGTSASKTESWWIPLTVMSASEAGARPDPVQWLAADEGVKRKHQFKHGTTANEWILFNYDMIAPYRVNYDSRNWQLLTATLASEQYQKVPQLARVQLLSDAFALAWSEQLDYGTALQIIKYLQRESEYLPIMAGLQGLDQIESVMKRTPEYGTFQKFVRHLIAGQYQQSGGLATKSILRPDDIAGVKKQILLSATACRVHVPGCEEHAVELFQQWMLQEDPDTNNPIPLDLRNVVYCVGVRRGGEREWRFMVERILRSNVASVPYLAYEAITCTQETWILNQCLEWCVTENPVVRFQDAPIVLRNILQSANGYYAARNFIYNRIADIYEALTGSIINYFLHSLVDGMHTQQELDEFLAWREKNKKYLSDGKQAIGQGIESAKVNIKWLNRNRKLVTEKMQEIMESLPPITDPLRPIGEQFAVQVRRPNMTCSCKFRL